MLHAQAECDEISISCSYIETYMMDSRCSLVPRPPSPAFVTYSTKTGGKAWTDLLRDACHC